MISHPLLQASLLQASKSKQNCEGLHRGEKTEMQCKVLVNEKRTLLTGTASEEVAEYASSYLSRFAKVSFDQREKPALLLRFYSLGTFSCISFQC